MKLNKSNMIELVIGVSIAIVLCFILQDSMVKVQSEQENSKNLRLEQTTTEAISLLEGNKNVIRSSYINYPIIGESYAVIHNDERGFSKNLYFGDSTEILDISVGQYSKSGIPGLGKPLLIAGHNGTHFNALQFFEKGDIVGIDTSYGLYTYEVYDIQTIHKDDFDDEQLNSDEEILIMYSCYPFNVVNTDTRYFVYAKKLAGPVIKEEGTWKN